MKPERSPAGALMKMTEEVLGTVRQMTMRNSRPGPGTTFAGIRPDDVPGFIAAQFAGAAAGTWVSTWLFREDQGANGKSVPE